MPIKCYQLPSCKPVSAQYERKVPGGFATAVSINKLVYFEREYRLDSGQLGVRSMIQIDAGLVNFELQMGDKISIGTRTYSLNRPILLNNNPLFSPFWEAEVKSLIKQ